MSLEVILMSLMSLSVGCEQEQLLGLHYQVRVWHCQRRSQRQGRNVFVPWRADLTRASLRHARRASGAPGEPPARQATETTLGSWAEQ